jgi:hypothetical protein
MQTISPKTNTLVHGHHGHQFGRLARQRAPQMTGKEAVPEQIAERLDLEFDFGWRSGSPLR